MPGAQEPLQPGDREAPGPLAVGRGIPRVGGALALGSLLALPLLAPVLHGALSALLTVLAGAPLTGGGSLWPGERVQGLLAASVLLALGSSAVALLGGAMAALAFLMPLRAGQRGLLAALLMAAFCLGTVVHLLAWRALFPLVTGDVQGWALAMLTLGLRYAPLAAALILIGLASFERAELETALCSGGPRALWRVARARVFRLATMAFAAVAALVLGESEVPPLVGVHVYAEEFLAQVALEPSAQMAAATGWPLMLAALLCAAVLAKMPWLRPPAAGALSLGWVGAWVFAPALIARGAWVLALVLAATPLLLLVAGSATATGRWPAGAGAALYNSLWVACLSSALACAWGWALATVFAGWGAAARAWLGPLLWLAMLWPTALTGIALAGWAPPAAWPEAGSLVLAHALRVLPFAAWILLALQDVQPRAMREQLRTLPQPTTADARWRRLWFAWRHVHAPAARPALAAAFLLGVGLSLAELTATVLTVPPGTETVILRLYNLLHYGDQRGVMLLALMQGLIVAAGVALLGSAAMRRARCDQVRGGHASA